MRKHVTLITGAGGEIGHGLIERLAADGDSPIITIDLKPLEPGIRERSSRKYTGSILETHLLERILSEYEVDTVYHLAAILSTRTEFTPVTGHQVNVEGTLKLLDFAQAQGESARASGGLPLPLVDRGLRSAGPRNQGDSGRGTRTRVEQPDHDVRLQQALLRAPRTLLRPSLQAARRRNPFRQGRFPRHSLSRV